VPHLPSHPRGGGKRDRQGASNFLAEEKEKACITNEWKRKGASF